MVAGQNKGRFYVVPPSIASWTRPCTFLPSFISYR